MTLSKHAEEQLLRLTIYVQIWIHIHIHMYIYVCVYIYIYTCIYIHIYMLVHIHTCTYIHTHVQNVHMHACKHVWNDGVAATAREAQIDPKISTLLPVHCNPEGDHPLWPTAQLSVHNQQQTSAEQPQPTLAHDTITTARLPGYNWSSVLVHSQSPQFMAHIKFFEPRDNKLQSVGPLISDLNLFGVTMEWDKVATACVARRAASTAAD